MSYDALLAKLAETVEAADYVCAPCVQNCLVQPCGPHCNYAYTDERRPACEKCEEREQAQRRIATLDGPALVKALADMLNEQGHVKLPSHERCKKARAALADAAAALGVEVPT